MATSRLLLVLLSLSTLCPAQKQASKGALGAAEDLRACVSALGSDPQLGPQIVALREISESYVKSLAPKPGSAPPTAPAEYVASAVALVDLCQPLLMSFAPGSPFAGTAKSSLETLFMDLSAKASDAQNTGGARLVPVSVQAVENGKPVDGWTIYSQWLPDATAKPSAFGSPTPRATRNLPPGAYSFHAEKVVDGKKISSGEGKVAIGGPPTAYVSIRLP